MADSTSPRTDSGFSLIELLIVMLVLGVLAAVVVMAVGGVRGEAEDSACPADWRNLNTSVEAYFVQANTTTLAPADASLDGYEQTLVDHGLMRYVSAYYDLDATGNIVQAPGSPCTA